MSGWKPWREAWQEALYGAGGFYRGAGPAAHFSTATHGVTGAGLARALAGVVDAEAVGTVVDLGCGRGELLTHLHALRPDLTLVGVDVVERPDGLPAAVGWWRAPGGAALPDGLAGLRDTLVLAHEWLDVVPCTVAEVDAHGGLHEVLVDPGSGAERPGDPVGDDERAWAETWWPGAAPGARVEVGLERDRAWAGLLERLDSGVALAVDYGHLRETRPAGGTLAAYRAGRQVTPVADGSCDLTAHVAVDSLRSCEMVTQRAALSRLGRHAAAPPLELAHSDPAGYLAGLTDSSAAAALRDPAGFGGFWWVTARHTRSS